MTKNILGTILLPVGLISGIVGSELGCGRKSPPPPVEEPEKISRYSEGSPEMERVRALVEKFRQKARQVAANLAEKSSKELREKVVLKADSDPEPDSLSGQGASLEKESEALERQLVDPESSAAYGAAKQLMKILAPVGKGASPSAGGK